MASRTGVRRFSPANVLVFIKEDLDVGFFGAKKFLGPYQSVTGGDVGVFAEVHEQVGLALSAVTSFLQGFKNTGFLEDFIDFASGPGDENVNAFFAGVFDEVVESEHAGGIEVARIFKPENDDLEILIGDGLLDLGAEEVGGTKEEVALYVHNGDGGDLTMVLFTKLAKVTSITHFVFDEVWFGGFAQEQGDGEARRQ